MADHREPATASFTPIEGEQLKARLIRHRALSEGPTEFLVKFSKSGESIPVTDTKGQKK